MSGGAVFLPPSMRSSYGAQARYQGRGQVAQQNAALRNAFGISTHSGESIGRGRSENMAVFTISRKTFEQIEDFIADNLASAEKVQAGLDGLTMAMAYAIRGFAQQKSGGPVAPRHRSVAALAYRIPVQRITGAYFAGWRARRIAHAHFRVWNDAREAYLIEFGLFQRVRRPILKMSMLGMLGLVQTTRTGDRFLQWVLAPRRSSAGQFRSFQSRVIGTTSLGGMAGPMGRLPG